MRHFFLRSLLNLSLLIALLLTGCTEEPPAIGTEEIRNTIISYLMARRHGGHNFEDQLYPDVNPTMFDPRDQSIYFGLRPEDCTDPERSRRMMPYVIDTSRLGWSRPVGDDLYQVAAYRGRATPEQGCACRTDIENLKIDTGRVLTFEYERGTFDISLRELAESLNNRFIYGGRIELAEKDGYRETSFYNHGAFVSRSGDPALVRFVGQLLDGVGPEDEAREERIQRLLDFVSDDIVYDFVEGNGRRELLKRPSETLMYGMTDCSNKTILFASMLEQIGEEYLLVYCPGHITVAVPRGSFPVENGHTFDWDDEEWVFCETTMPQFRIGKDVIPAYYTFDSIHLIQRPYEERGIINPHTGRVPIGM